MRSDDNFQNAETLGNNRLSVIQSLTKFFQCHSYSDDLVKYSCCTLPQRLHTRVLKTPLFKIINRSIDHMDDPGRHGSLISAI